MANEDIQSPGARTEPDLIEKGGRTNYIEYRNAGFDDKHLNEDAKQATAAEHSLSFWQAIKTYRRAAFWSICE